MRQEDPKAGQLSQSPLRITWRRLGAQLSASGSSVAQLSRSELSSSDPSTQRERMEKKRKRRRRKRRKRKKKQQEEQKEEEKETTSLRGSIM